MRCDSKKTLMQLLLFLELPGAHTAGATPVPIPNTVVKPRRADGTWLATVWESRSAPGLISDASSGSMPEDAFFFSVSCGFLGLSGVFYFMLEQDAIETAKQLGELLIVLFFWY